MKDDLAYARFRRMLRELPAGHVLGITEVHTSALTNGLSLTRAAVLLDADPGWQRLFLDEYGFVVAARCAHDECVSAENCDVAWRRLSGTAGARKVGYANRPLSERPERRQSLRGSAHP